VTPGIAIALAGGLAILAWIAARDLLARRRRRALFTDSLDAVARDALARWLPQAERMPAALRDRLERLTAVFVGEKAFVGCGGFQVTPETKVAIAAQACLLVLGRNTHVYDRLLSVLVYPAPFVVPGAWHDEDGVVTEEPRVLAGESWDVSRVILSWEDVDSRGAPGEAYNVVIHEFAHYLDHESDGAPWIAGSGARRRWWRLLDEELERLRAQADAGAPSFLDPYAAEDRGEFFAVASEAFFESPNALKREYPKLYDLFSGFYRQDPARRLAT
jgi:MtfA peptidase